MKLKRILAVILSATVAFGFWSCQEEEIETGIDPNLPAPSNLTYDEDNSSATSMTVYWDASAPDAAGATSYTVQLLTAPDQGDNYDSSTSKTLQSTAEVHDLAMFGGLSSFDKYLIRVRANYKRSKYSEWTYITLNGEPVFHEVGFGMVDPSLPTIDTCGYDATLSTAESMWFNFDAHTAKAANAAEVVVRIVNKKSTLPSYTNTESISATGTEFVNLTNKNRYTVWARAAYKLSDGRTAYSDWMRAQEGDKNLYEVGKGAVREEPPTAKLNYASSSTLVFSWSNYGFEDVASDRDLNVRVQLYKDAACSNLVVAWTFKGNDTDVVTTSNKIFNSIQPCFSFPGLEPGTKYYFKVTNLDTELSSEPVEGETTAFTIKEPVGDAVQAGDLVLGEDFGELIIGGDYVNKAPGISSTGRASLTNQKAPTGEQPDKSAKIVFGPVYHSNEVGFFNTMALSVPSTRLDKWGTYNEGTANSYTCERPGYFKLGASSYASWITTPLLANLAGPATIEVTFTAARYESDQIAGSVYTVTGSSISDAHVVTGTKTAVYSFNVPEDKSKWGTYTCTIKNVMPNMRLAFGVAEREVPTEAGSVQRRMYIGEVTIKLVEYTGEAITVPVPANLTLKAKTTTMAVSWDESDVDTYTVEYKKTADSKWTVLDPITTNSLTIEGLEPDTEYDVRVKAAKTGFESQYATASARTASASALNTEIGSASELVEWLAAATEAATDEYKLTADIDMAGKSIIAASGFAGTLDGQGHTIKNLKATAPLVAVNKGTIKNINVDASCKFMPAAPIFGVIVADNQGTIENCHNAATVRYHVDNVTEMTLMGGIAGQSTGTIKDCSNAGEIVVKSAKGLGGAAAGIAAYQQGAVINCVNSGPVTMTSLFTNAGMKGGPLTSNILPCEGGIIGIAGKGTTISNCENSGKISFLQTAIEQAGGGRERMMIGGIAGNPNGKISNSNNHGEIVVSTKTLNGKELKGSGTSYIICVGGISGGDYYADGQSATDIFTCNNDGHINIDTDAANANSAVGGIVGWPCKEGGGTVSTKDCTNSGKLTLNGLGKVRIGGIQGGSGIMDNCTNTADIEIPTTGNNYTVAGLLAGFHSNGYAVTNCTAKGTISSPVLLLGASGMIGNIGNAAHTTGDGCKVDCVLDVPKTTNVGMVIGYFNGKTKDIKMGTEVPVKVKGTVNGTVLNADNFSGFLNGPTNFDAKVHIINAQYGE